MVVVGPPSGYVGPVLDQLGAILGAMLARLRAMLAHLVAMLAHLGGMLAHLGAMWAQACGPCWAIWGLCWASLRPFWGVCWAMLTHLDPQDRKNGICFYISPMERRECHTAVPWPRGLGPWPYRATPPVTDPKRLWAWRAGGRQHRHVNTDVKRFFTRWRPSKHQNNDR